MIQVGLPAQMVCIEPDCAAAHPVRLILLSSGGLGFSHPEKTWQVLMSMEKLGGEFLARCPAHHVKADVPRVHLPNPPRNPYRAGH